MAYNMVHYSLNSASCWRLSVGMPVDSMSTSMLPVKDGKKGLVRIGADN